MVYASAMTAPALIQIQCQVEGVTLTHVALQSEEHGTLSVPANASQIGRAIALRDSSALVEARVFRLEDGLRLLSLRDAGVSRRKRSPKERADYIMTKWHGVLRHLAGMLEP